MQLTEVTCKLAVNKSLENARELVIDADILANRGRICRAFTLYHLANEELGKCTYCISVLCLKLYNDRESLKQISLLFKDHVTKIQYSHGIDLLYATLLVDDDPKEAGEILIDASSNIDKAKDINDLKNKSLYTTYHNNSFKNPQDFISLSTMDKAKAQAHIRLKLTTAFWQFTEEHYDRIILDAPSRDPENVIERLVNKFKS